MGDSSLLLYLIKRLLPLAFVDLLFRCHTCCHEICRHCTALLRHIILGQNQPHLFQDYPTTISWKHYISPSTTYNLQTPFKSNTTSSIKTKLKMTDTMPLPTQQSPIPRNDSFSAEDLSKALKASATKPRNELSLRIALHDEPTVPPPSPRESRPASVYGHRR